MPQHAKEEASKKGMRYACLTAEQQKLFDSWNTQQQKYVLFRAQNVPKGQAYLMAGYKPSKQASQQAWGLENRTCVGMLDIIEAMQGRSQVLDVLKENSELSKKVDEVAKKTVPELTNYIPKVAIDSPVMDLVDPEGAIEKMNDEQVRNLQFYRKIANGTIKTVIVTKQYDENHKFKGEKVEERSDIQTRILAQKEVMRLIGAADVIELGKVQANNINVLIVDASKHEEKQTDPNENINLKNLKEIDGETVLVAEEKKERV